MLLIIANKSRESFISSISRYVDDTYLPNPAMTLGFPYIHIPLRFGQFPFSFLRVKMLVWWVGKKGTKELLQGCIRGMLELRPHFMRHLQIHLFFLSLTKLNCGEHFILYMHILILVWGYMCILILAYDMNIYVVQFWSLFFIPTWGLPKVRVYHI